MLVKTYPYLDICKSLTQNQSMSSTIVLLTDFSLRDPYLGQMKGVLASLAPQVPIIDLGHELKAHNVAQAEFILRASHGFFPKQSIFICVVDPEVGTTRAIIMAQADGQIFLAPNNGLLSFLPAKTSWWQLALPPTASHTFHGRDIFAPAAAQLAKGTSPQQLGTKMSAGEIVRLQPNAPQITAHQIICQVLHVDGFGNCLLNLPIQDLENTIWALASGQKIYPVQTYAQLSPGAMGILASSQGVMELAMNEQSCAQWANLYPGQTLILTRIKDQRYELMV